VLKEEKREYYAEIAKILSSYGLKAYQMEPLMDVVQEAIKMAYYEGKRAAELNPFRK
jgi:predicted transcriptional regulator